MYACRIFEKNTVLAMESSADRLRYAREQMGIATPTDAIARFGWTKSTYYGHENGSRGLTRHTARNYAKAYHISIDWLLTGIGKLRDPILQRLIENYHQLAPGLQKSLADISDTLSVDVRQGPQ